MARISGVDLPRNKRIDIGLTYVFGIGNTSAKQIVAHANVNPSTKCGELTDEEITSIRAIVEQIIKQKVTYVVLCHKNIKRLTDQEIGSAKGRRHRVGLPVRGQRTKTNARTRKGKIKIPVSKKK